MQPEKSAQAGQYLAWGAAEHWSRQQLNSYEKNRSGGGEDVAQQRAEVWAVLRHYSLVEKQRASWTRGTMA